jgi:hypothetical protein
MRKSTKLIELKNRARRQGWLKWLRKGPGEEADERALAAGCWFDVRRGQHVVDFADRFGTLTEGAFQGRHFDLLPWQYESLQRMFGWVKPSPEWGYPVRRHRYCYLEIPKKTEKRRSHRSSEITCCSAIREDVRSTCTWQRPPANKLNGCWSTRFDRCGIVLILAV